MENFYPYKILRANRVARLVISELRHEERMRKRAMQLERKRILLTYLSRRNSF